MTAIIASTIGVTAAQGAAETRVTASDSAPDYPAAGAMDADRFSFAPNRAWQTRAGETQGWWLVRFDHPRAIGAILQIQGDHEFVLRNVPGRYVWQFSTDGQGWEDLEETRVADETRLFRIHRLNRSVRATALRLAIAAINGHAATLREVEFYDQPGSVIPFPEWIIAVNTTHHPALPGHGQEFIPLAQSCAGFETLRAQQVWLGGFDEALLRIEPRPLCAFLSGNFKDWCEVNREWWRGTAEILKAGRLPMWASCGGAQGLAILAETGVEQPWDCPHCRDPARPKLPIYTHIGHRDRRPCGDYSACEFERGRFRVKPTVADPAFAGLPAEFEVMQSHCGQIEWAPAGWELVATAGAGARTRIQCLKVRDRPIYAAQFHIEMAGTPESSSRIMANFLHLARAWGGYQSPARRRHDTSDARRGKDTSPSAASE